MSHHSLPGFPRSLASLSPLTWTSVLLTAVGLIAGVTIHKGWMVLAAAGLFGPGILRQLRLLRDRDELQLRLIHEAGYRAFLAAGVLLFAIIIANGWNNLNLDDLQVQAPVLLSVMLMVFFLSYLFEFWGAVKASFRVLLTFGSFWLLFVILSHAREPVAMAMEALVPLPLILLAFAVRRWSRATGVLLLTLAFFVFFFFHLWRGFTDFPGLLYTLVLLWLPLLACGIALLLGERELASR